MSALLEICRTRTAVAVLASGVVISLTALTGGIAPALAAPHTGSGHPDDDVCRGSGARRGPTQETQAPERATPPEKKLREGGRVENGA